ncbi:MAG: hypothetical protein ACTSP4_02200 [Candidatus Hodarchaeales archaeon]
MFTRDEAIKKYQEYKHIADNLSMTVNELKKRLAILTNQRDKIAEGRGDVDKQITGMEKIITEADNALRYKENQILELEKKHIFELDQREKEYRENIKEINDSFKSELQILRNELRNNEKLAREKLAEKNEIIQRQKRELESKGEISADSVPRSTYQRLLHFLDNDDRILLLRMCQQNLPNSITYSELIKKTGLLLFRIQDIVAELSKSGFVEEVKKNEIRFVKFPWDD